MEIVLATGNMDKVREMKAAFKGLKVRLLTVSDFKNSPKPRESGKTLEANALIKARALLKHTGVAALADDTGLEVSALGGRPGVYSSRYAGYGASYDDNCRKLLREMKNSARRTASFRTAVAVCLPDGREFTVSGKIRGVITREKSGGKGFGYDPVFRPSGYRKTFAEMSLKEKNRISHRGIALKKARRLISELSKVYPNPRKTTPVRVWMKKIRRDGGQSKIELV